MTIPAQNPSVTYIGNGATTAFNIPFKFNVNSDIVATLIATTGVKTVLTSGQYSLTGAGNVSGGTLTYTPALASGVKINIRRDMPITQTLDLEQEGGLRLEDIENELDDLTMMVQQVDATASEAQATIDQYLPDILAIPGYAASAAASAASAVGSANSAAASAALAAAYAAQASSVSGTRDFESLTVLKANTTLTYSGATSNTVVVGQTIRIRDTAFVYIVADSSASSPHITTAGGVKLYVKPIDGQFHIDAFGAIGDGTTDDTNAFLNFRLAAIATGGMVTLNFSQGKTYMCGNPYWPCDIRNLIVNGNGSNLKNNAVANVNKSLLNPALGNTKTGFGTFYNPVDFYFVNTTTPGSSSLTCITPANAGNFFVGEMIMLASHDIQYGGQPFNLRYFEYKEIATVDAGTGTITFTTPIRYAHQSDAPYVVDVHGDGRANISKIEQGSLFNIDHTYNDINFIQNDVDAAGATSQAVYTKGKNLTFNRCSARWFLVTECGTVRLNKCLQFGGSREFDKLTENCILDECTLNGTILSSTSITNFKAYRTIFNGGYTIAPVNLELIDCIVNASSQNSVRLLDGYSTTENLRIIGGVHQYIPFASIQSGGTPNVQLGVTATWNASTRELTINTLNVAGNPRQVGKRLMPGQLVHTATLAGGIFYPAGNYGVVRSISNGGVPNTVVAVIDFITPLAGTEYLTVYNEPRTTVIDVSAIGTGNSYGFNQNSIAFNHTQFRVRELLVTSNYSRLNIPFGGRVRRIVVDVKRAYTGATGGNIVLNIINNQPSSGSAFSRAVDLKTVGRRETSLISAIGWTGTGGETSNASAPLAGGAYASMAIGSVNLSASTMASTGNDQLAIVDIYMEIESPYNRP